MDEEADIKVLAISGIILNLMLGMFIGMYNFSIATAENPQNYVGASGTSIWNSIFTDTKNNPYTEINNLDRDWETPNRS